jgi:hypothetical protein
MDKLISLWSRFKIYIIIAVVLIIAGLILGYQLYSPSPPVQEVYHQQAKQPDGSTVLEVKPDAAAKPKHQIPKGGTVERVITVTVKPIAGNVHNLPATGIPATEQKQTVAAQCPPVTVDLSLIRLPDNTRRVVASSPDGEVAGMDIPVEAANPPPKPLLWAAGASIEPFKQTLGAWVDREVGPLRIGAEINQLANSSLREWDVRAKLGIRF